MKANIFILIIPFFTIFYLPQSIAQIGIKGGFGVSDIAFRKQGQTPYLTYEINSLEHRLPLLSFQGGAFSTFELGKRIELQGEVLFAMQGLDYSSEYLYDDITYKIYISYLKLPILFRYKVSLKEKKRSGFLAGPYASWKLKATRVRKVEGQKEKVKMSNVKDADLGIVAGYFIDIDLASGQLVIDLRSSYSLINMMVYVEGYLPEYYGSSKEYARNVNISLNVGYRFLNLW